MNQAREYGVLPLDGRNILDVMNTELPSQVLSRPVKYVFHAGAQHLPHETRPNLAVFGYTLTAHVDRKESSRPLRNSFRAGFSRIERFAPLSKTSAKGTLFVNDQQVATTEYTLPTVLFYTCEGIDIGRDALSHVSDTHADRGDFPFPQGALHEVDLNINLPPVLDSLAAAGGR